MQSVSKGQEPNFLDTLAEAQFRTGDVAAAVATEQKAINWIKSNVKDATEADLKDFCNHLDRYSQAANAARKRKTCDNKNGLTTIRCLTLRTSYARLS